MSRRGAIVIEFEVDGDAFKADVSSVTEGEPTDSMEKFISWICEEIEKIFTSSDAEDVEIKDLYDGPKLVH